MIAALNHEMLPPTLHVDAPSPHIDWSAGTVRLLTEPIPWPDTDHPRTAAVSSFGISGTNAHLILQQAPPHPLHPVSSRHDPGSGARAADLWPVSARTPAALAAQAERLHQHLIDHPDLDLTDVAYSLATTRTHHPYRAVITASADNPDPRARSCWRPWRHCAADQPHPGLTRHHHRPHQAGKTVFVFPGQGAQYPGMGAQLYQHHRGFAAALDECDQALRPYTGWSVREVIGQDPGAPALDRVDVVQPVLVRGDGVAGRGVGRLRDRARRGDRALPRRNRRRLHRRGAHLGRGRQNCGATQPGAGAAVRYRCDGLGLAGRRATASAAAAVGCRVEHRRDQRPHPQHHQR